MSSPEQPDVVPTESSGHSDAATGSVDGGGAEPDETVLDETTVTVRRSPRFFNFMIVGAAAGAVAALILTFVFPANAEFDRGQVFGFLLLAGVAFGVAIGCLVALALDRSSRRTASTAVADRLGSHAQTPPNDAAGVSDSPVSDTPAVVTSTVEAPSTGAGATDAGERGAASVSSSSRTNTTNTDSE